MCECIWPRSPCPALIGAGFTEISITILKARITKHDFRNNFEHGLRKRIAEDKCRRDPKWTESVGVGSLDFIDALRTRVPLGRALERRQESGGWTLREALWFPFCGRK